MQIDLPVSYTQVTQAAAATVKDRRGQFYGLLVTSSTTGTVTVYDGTSTAGVVILNALAVTAGQIVAFGGAGIDMKNGIHVVVGGTSTVNVLFK